MAVEKINTVETWAYVNSVAAADIVSILGEDAAVEGESGGNDTYTKLLLGLDGDQSASAHDVNLIGTPLLSAAQSKFGDTSLYLGGSGSGEYLTIPDSDDWNLGSGNFTIDLWAHLDSGLMHQFCRQGPPTGDNDNSIVWWVDTDKTLSLLYSVSGSGWTTLTSTAAASFNYSEWVHFAVVRNSADIDFYVDGAAVGTSKDISTNTINDSGQSMLIGAGTSGGLYVSRFKGYMDEFRFTKGEARWTSGFTPATAAYTADANTKLLMHFDGDRSSSAHELTVTGSPYLSASETQFDGSMKFDGSNDIITIPDSEDWALGDLFTIDLWAYITTGNKVNYMVTQEADTNNKWAFGVNATNKLTWNMKTGGTWSTPEPVSTSSVAIGSWIHLAVTNDSTNIRIFAGGVLFGTFSSRTIPDMASVLTIGGGYDAWQYTGYLDEVRVSKGIARWTEAFTPPTSPYTVVLTEDLTSYTEVDPSSDLTVTSNLIVVDTMIRNVTAGVYKDFGAGYFSGDFSFTFDYDFTGSSANYAACSLCALSMGYYLGREDRNNANDGLEIYIGSDVTSSLIQTVVREWASPDDNDLTGITDSIPQHYYFTFSRVGTTVTVLIHRDADRTILYDTLVMTVSSALAYRYLYPVTSFDSTFAGTAAMTGQFANLIL